MEIKTCYIDRWIAGVLVLLAAWEAAVPAAAIKASSSSHTSQRSGNQDGAAATKHIWPTLENSQLLNFEGDLSIIAKEIHPRCVHIIDI